MLKSLRAAAIGAALLSPLALAQPAAALGFYSGTVSGYFTNLQTTGDTIDIDGSTVFDGNPGDAAFTGDGTAAITWGTSAVFNPNHSSLSFTSDNFVNKRACCGDEGSGAQYFKIGSLTYFNGTSDTGTLIYGATLHVDVTDATVLVPGGTAPADISGFDLDMQFLATVNTGLGAARDSDFIIFPGLDATFNVYENGTAVIDLYAALFGDPQMSFETFDLNSGDGFVGQGVGDPDPIDPNGVPEPATWAMLIVGFLGVGASLRRRRSALAPA